MNNLGTLLETKGDTAAAEPLLREALEGQRSVLGSQHPQTLNSICNLGALLDAKGDLAAAKGCKGSARCSAMDTRTRLSPSATFGTLLVINGETAAAESLFARR